MSPAARRIDNRRLVAFLGEEQHTSTVDAVRANLQELGCLDSASSRSTELQAARVSA
jgi:hypothetical protein